MSRVLPRARRVAPVVDALAARGIARPFRIQELVAARRARRARRPRTVADGLGQDARVRACRSSSASIRDDARPSALVLVPTRELAAQVTEELEPLAQAEGAPRRRRVRRRRRCRPRRSAPSARTSWSRRPAGSRISSSAGWSTSRRSASSSSTRPTGCSTWASSRRSTRSSGGCRSNRQTMFFSATLDGEVGELARAYTNSPSASRAALPDERRRARSSTASSRSRPTRRSRRSSST